MRVVVAVWGRLFTFDIGFGMERLDNHEPQDEGALVAQMELSDAEAPAELRFGFSLPVED